MALKKYNGKVIQAVVPVGVTPDGEYVALPTDAQGRLLVGGVSIDGNVTIGSEVEIKNDQNNPIPVNGTVGIDGLGEVQASPTANTLLGRLKNLATLLAGGLPASLGTKVAAESLPVTLSSDGPFAVNFGATADAVATTDTGTFSHIALLKRLLTKVPGFTRATTTAAITISGSTTISTSVDLLGTSILAFVAPAAWTTSTLKLQGSNDNSNWFDIYDQYGVQVSSFSAITASVAYSIDVTAMLPYRYIRFVAGTAQAADRTFTVVTRPLA